MEYADPQLMSNLPDAALTKSISPLESEDKLIQQHCLRFVKWLDRPSGLQ